MKSDDNGNRMVIIIHKKNNAKPSFPKCGSGVHFLVAKPIQIAKPDSIWNVLHPSLVPFVYSLFFVNIFHVDNLIRFLACVVRIPGTPTLHWKHFSSSPARLKQIGAKKLFGAKSFSNVATIYQKKAFITVCIGKDLHRQREEQTFVSGLSLEPISCPRWVPPTSSRGSRGRRLTGAWRTRPIMLGRWSWRWWRWSWW